MVGPETDYQEVVQVRQEEGCSLEVETKQVELGPVVVVKQQVAAEAMDQVEEEKEPREVVVMVKQAQEMEGEPQVAETGLPVEVKVADGEGKAGIKKGC